MLRIGVVIAIWLVASTALAQDLVVADSTATPDAVHSLLSLLGPDARLAPEPTLASLDDVLAWAETQHASIAIVVAVDKRRVYVAIPSARRVIERVLPDDVTADEPYAIAIAASELVELARWGDEATLDAAAAVSIPAHATQPEPEPEPEPEVEPEPREQGYDPPTPIPRPPAVAWSFALGVGGRFGLDRRLASADFDARVDARFLRTLGAGANLFAGLVLRGGFPARYTSVVGTHSLALRYARPELELRAGIAFQRGDWAVRPSVRLSLAWVHVSATDSGTNPGDATDDRVAFAGGVGAEARYRLLERGFLGFDAGLDATGGRAPYVAYGRIVLREPVLRVTLGLFAGITLDR